GHEGDDDPQTREDRSDRGDRIGGEGRQMLMGREAGQDPGQREASGRPGCGEKGRDAADGNQEGHLTPHVHGGDEETERHPEEERIPEGHVREEAFARDRDCQAESGDDDGEGEERRSSRVARMDPELLRQHEAEQPDHPHAPTMRRKAASRSASGPRISSTLPVATIAPSWITATRSQSFSAMSSRWEAMKTVPPPPM